MKISVKVKPGAREYKVEKVDGNNYNVWVKERPEKGKANEAVIRVLAGYFKVPKSNVVVVTGFSSKRKIVEIK